MLSVVDVGPHSLYCKHPGHADRRLEVGLFRLARWSQQHHCGRLGIRLTRTTLLKNPATPAEWEVQARVRI
jgi:hypothetical protein